MTPKEYAKELVDKFIPKVGYLFLAKECASITVDEIIANIEPFPVSMWVIEARVKYWQEVKTEIFAIS